MAPISRQLQGKRDLVFVPSPETTALPFAALRTEDGAYLIEHHAVGVAPSAATYLAIRPWRKPQQPSVLVVSVSPNGGRWATLPAAEREADAVAGRYRNAVRLAGDDATPTAMLQLASAADIIHFTGHGSARSDSGDGATLLALAGDQAESTLSARQIESLRLPRAPLVVLAACSTARGDVRWSEGALSLARAFLVAGAPAVVATAWQIDDAEAERFFPRFHDHLAAGLTVAEAVRMTQLECLHDPRTSPATWAAIQTIGR